MVTLKGAAQHSRVTSFRPTKFYFCFNYNYYYLNNSLIISILLGERPMDTKSFACKQICIYWSQAAR